MRIIRRYESDCEIYNTEQYIIYSLLKTFKYVVIFTKYYKVAIDCNEEEIYFSGRFNMYTDPENKINFSSFQLMTLSIFNYLRHSLDCNDRVVYFFDNGKDARNEFNKITFFEPEKIKKDKEIKKIISDTFVFINHSADNYDFRNDKRFDEFLKESNLEDKFDSFHFWQYDDGREIIVTEIKDQYTMDFMDEIYEFINKEIEDGEDFYVSAVVTMKSGIRLELDIYVFTPSNYKHLNLI